MRVGLLECDHVDDLFRSIAGDYFDMFERILPALDLVRYDTIGGVVPGSPDECEGWVVTGSRHSAYEDLDWIVRLRAFVRSVRRAGTPFVGICFGHQVLAHATGGRAEQAAAWGVGAHDIVKGERARLLYMHQDQVVALPAGATLLASTDHCQHAVVAVDDAMIGIQAHPEFPGEYEAALLETREARIGHDAVEQALASLDAPRDEEVAVAWMLGTLGS